MSKLYLASDHAGYELKRALVPYIGSLGHEVVDMGPDTFDPEDDYPDFITPCAQRVVEEKAVGVVIGGSGQGEAMAANRVMGARAALYYGKDLDIVRLAREHNDANILSLGARFLSTDEAMEAVRAFLETPFGGEERHVRRLGKF